MNQVETYLDQGANVLEIYQHETVLHAAVSSGNERVVKCILNAIKKKTGERKEKSVKAHIDTKNSNGHTPLMCAVESEKMEIAQMLLQFGASFYEKNYEGVTIFDYAIKKNHHLGFFN